MLNYVNRIPGRIDICHFFTAIDYGMFGEKQDMEAALSCYLQELRDSEKAEGQNRIFTHGEKEFESRNRILEQGVPLSEKTYAEMKMIAAYTGAEDLLPAFL